MPLSGLENVSLEGLGVAFSGLSGGAPVKAKRRRREQWIWEPNRKTLEINTIHPMRYPSMTNLLRAHQAPINILQHPLQLPLHTQQHIEQHPHPQPLHLWVRV